MNEEEVIEWNPGDPTDSTEACDGSESELRAEGNVLVLDMCPDSVRCKICFVLSSDQAMYRLHLKTWRHKRYLTRAKRFFRLWANSHRASVMTSIPEEQAQPDEYEVVS